MTTIVYRAEGSELVHASEQRPNRTALMFLASLDIEHDNPGISEEMALRLGGLSADLTLRDYDDARFNIENKE